MAIFNDGGVGQSDRSAWDRKRHRQLVEDAIRKNMGDIIAEESIIGQSKSKKIKIPIRGLKEYQFVYGKNNGGTASGSGKEKTVDRAGARRPSGGANAVRRRHGHGKRRGRSR